MLRFLKENMYEISSSLSALGAYFVIFINLTHIKWYKATTFFFIGLQKLFWKWSIGRSKKKQTKKHHWKIKLILITSEQRHHIFYNLNTETKNQIMQWNTSISSNEMSHLKAPFVTSGNFKHSIKWHAFFSH